MRRFFTTIRHRWRMRMPLDVPTHWAVHRPEKAWRPKRIIIMLVSLSGRLLRLDLSHTLCSLCGYHQAIFSKKIPLWSVHRKVNFAELCTHSRSPALWSRHIRRCTVTARVQWTWSSAWQINCTEDRASTHNGHCPWWMSLSQVRIASYLFEMNSQNGHCFLFGTNLLG